MLFPRAHLQGLLLILVLVPAEVKGPKEDDPVKFSLKGGAKGSGVFLYPFHANINVGCKRFPFRGKLKGDNVGVGVVVEVGFIKRY